MLQAKTNTYTIWKVDLKKKEKSYMNNSPSKTSTRHSFNCVPTFSDGAKECKKTNPKSFHLPEMIWKQMSCMQCEAYLHGICVSHDNDSQHKSSSLPSDKQVKFSDITTTAAIAPKHLKKNQDIGKAIWHIYESKSKDNMSNQEKCLLKMLQTGGWKKARLECKVLPSIGLICINTKGHNTKLDVTLESQTFKKKD